jgi:hypothetical protein
MYDVPRDRQKTIDGPPVHLLYLRPTYLPNKKSIFLFVRFWALLGSRYLQGELENIAVLFFLTSGLRTYTCRAIHGGRRVCFFWPAPQDMPGSASWPPQKMEAALSNSKRHLLQSSAKNIPFFVCVFCLQTQ